MGTRHTTKVIFSGKEVLSQYGQWDGYPTVAGAVLIDAIKRLGLERLKYLMGKLEYIPESVQTDIIISQCTLSPKGIMEKLEQIACSDKEYWITDPNGNKLSKETYPGLPGWDQVKILMEEMDYKDAAFALMMTRATGYDVLNVMDGLDQIAPNSKIPAAIADYNKTDLAACYTINLDTASFSIRWLSSYEKTFPFDALPDMKTLESIEYGNGRRG